MNAPEFLAVPDLAVQLASDVLQVHQLLRDGRLLGLRGADGVLRIPADFVQDGHVVKGLSGVLTLLRDNRYDDAAAVGWLFTEDDTLPGTPVEALRENRGTEVKRRAQALA